MSRRLFYIRNTNPNLWKKAKTNQNCGSFALDTPSWVAPYDNDDEYTNEIRTSLIREMMDEGLDRETIMETILFEDQASILRACHWIEPILPEEIQPEDRVVAYRLFFDEESFERGEIDDDYHFRVRINGFWFEKCGQEEIRFCGRSAETEPWKTSPYLIYDSDIVYFRFKKDKN
jgi:hypothetical protein